jgi:hypothetical protein
VLQALKVRRFYIAVAAVTKDFCSNERYSRADECTYKFSLQVSPEGQRFLIEMCIIKGSPLFSHEKIEIIEIYDASES